MADQPVKVHRDISIVESEHTGIQPETPEICAVSVDDSSAAEDGKAGNGISVSPFDAQYIPPPINQMEYVQLCKTLYTLLQDSPEEQELLQAMGRVANSLLKIGEDNVTTDESTGQTHSETSPSKAFGIEQTERLLNAQQPIASMDDHNTTDTQPDEKKIDTNRTWSGDQPTEECHETPQSEASASTFDVAVADAAELEAKWYLNFEQFVAGIQQEPELCQFFAEQNIIDLSGTSVDPILSQYTRTILSST